MSILKSIEVRTYLVSLMILVSSIIILSEVLFRNGLVFYGDLSFPITIERYSYAFQMPRPYPNMLFIYLVPFFAFASALHFSIEVLVKLMLLAGLFLCGFSSYIAVKEVSKSAKGAKKTKIVLASLVASYFYMLNPWSMDRVGHYFLWTSYALAPLVLLLAIKLTQQDKLNYQLVFLTSLVWSIASTSPFGVLFNAILLFSWMFYSALLATLSKQYSKITIYSKALVLTSSLYILFNAHWILPYITSSMTQIPEPSYVLSWETVELLSRNSNFPNVIRLVAYWWPQVKYWPTPPLYIPWILASVILPLIALTALLIRRDKYTVYFSFMYIISILLSMGPNGPFPEIYRWIVFDAPFSNAFGWVFRDPNKWNGLTALMCSFLLGVSLSEILSRNHKQINANIASRFRHFTKHIPSVLIVLLTITSLMLYASPAVYAHFTKIYTPVNIPQEYYHINNWLQNQNGDFRVLWLAPISHGTPVNGMFRYSWAPNKPYTPAIDSWSSAKPSMAPATNEAKRYTDFLYKSIMDGYVEKYLAHLGVKYIIYHNDILGAETQGQLDIENLMNQKGLKLVWREGFIYVFEVQSYTPRIFVPSKTVLVVGGLDSLTMLDSIPPLNSNDTSLIFLQQKFYGTSILNITKEAVIINKDVADLALSFLDKKYVVAPFEYTIHADPFKDWAKTNVYEDWWNWPSPKDLTGYWDWDYGMGLVKTIIPDAKLVVPYIADYADTYSIWVRYLESPLGGEVSISVDTNSVGTISTLGERGFRWLKTGLVSLKTGKHYLTLKNVRGFNAINLIALVPTPVENRLLDLVQNLDVTYILEPHAMKTQQPMPATEGATFQSLASLLSQGGFEESTNTGKVTPNPGETLHFPIKPWTVTHWSGSPNTLSFSVDNSESFGGESSALIESLNITNRGAIDYRTIRRASITINEPNKTLIRLYVEAMYKTSEDFATDQGGVKLNIYTENSDGEWLGDFSSPIFDSSLEWRRIYHIVDLSTETARFSPEIFAMNFTGKVWFDDFHLAYKTTCIVNNSKVLILDGNTVATANLTFNKPAKWIFAVDAPPESEEIELSIKTDSINFSLPLNVLKDKYHWLYTDPVSLSPENHTLRITSKVPATLNKIIIYPWRETDMPTETKRTTRIVNYTQISPTEWSVHINTTKPFILEFTETYDPFWTADSDGFSTQSFPVNSVINGFSINKTGSYTLIVKYKPQSYFYIGLWITTVSFISMFLLLVSPKLRALFSGFRAGKTRVFPKTPNKSPKTPKLQTNYHPTRWINRTSWLDRNPHRTALQASSEKNSRS